jgi:hypothetical protein
MLRGFTRRAPSQIGKEPVRSGETGRNAIHVSPARQLRLEEHPQLSRAHEFSPPGTIRRLAGSAMRFGRLMRSPRKSLGWEMAKRRIRQRNENISSAIAMGWF